VVLDTDSTEIPMYGQQEQSAYKGHFGSSCYHPPLLFDREGDCLAAKLRRGNVHSADSWEVMLLPEIEWQQKPGKEVVIRALPRGRPGPSPSWRFTRSRRSGARSMPSASRRMTVWSATLRTC